MTLRLKNLDFDDENQKAGDGENYGESLVEIYLHPGENKLIKFKVVDPDVGISYATSCSYSILWSYILDLD